jgi:hypothetical protein
MNERQTASMWRPTAHILGYMNCGIEPRETTPIHLDTRDRPAGILRSGMVESLRQSSDGWNGGHDT